MVLRKLFLFATCLLIHASIFGQGNTPKIKLCIESQGLIFGEFNASYNFLGGARASYYFSKNKNVHSNISIGVSSNFGPSHTSLWASDLSLGCDLLLGDRWYFMTQIGFQYVNENQVQLIIERELNWINNSMGIIARLGVGAKLGNRISTHVFFNQYNTVASSIGLACNYSF